MKVLNNIKTKNGNFLIITDVCDPWINSAVEDNYLRAYMDQDGKFLCPARHSEWEWLLEQVEPERVGGVCPEPCFEFNIDELFQTWIEVEQDGKTIFETASWY